MNELVAESGSGQVQFYWQLFGAEDIREFKQRLLEVIEKLGFSDFCYGLTAARCGQSGNVLSSWEQLPQAYKNQDQECEDMIYQHCEHSQKPFFLSEVEGFINGATFESEQFSRTRNIIECYHSNGYCDVYFIPFRTKVGTGICNALLSVMTKDCTQHEFRQIVDKSKTVLHLLAEAVDFIGATKHGNYFDKIDKSEKNVIAQKPLRLLEVMVKGNMALKDAADKLCISLDTANKHIASAKKSLGAKTQAAAIYNALKLGLISCDDECRAC